MTDPTSLSEDLIALRARAEQLIEFLTAFDEPERVQVARDLLAALTRLQQASPPPIPQPMTPDQLQWVLDHNMQICGSHRVQIQDAVDAWRADQQRNPSLTTEVRAVRDSPPWQPIATAPRDGTPFVVGHQDDPSAVGLYVFRSGRWVDQFDDEFVGASGSRALAGYYTHWCAVPDL
jgi:hypothetical protein